VSAGSKVRAIKFSYFSFFACLSCGGSEGNDNFHFVIDPLEEGRASGADPVAEDPSVSSRDKELMKKQVER
jgi:hypothetical protein